RPRAQAEREGSGDSTWHTSCGRAAQLNPRLAPRNPAGSRATRLAPAQPRPAPAQPRPAPAPSGRFRFAAPGLRVRLLFLVKGIISVVGAFANSFFLPATVGRPPDPGARCVRPS